MVVSVYQWTLETVQKIRIHFQGLLCVYAADKYNTCIYSRHQGVVAWQYNVQCIYIPEVFFIRCRLIRPTVLGWIRRHCLKILYSTQNFEAHNFSLKPQNIIGQTYYVCTHIVPVYEKLFLQTSR